MDRRTFIALGLIIAIALGVLGVFFASRNPDGLEGTILVITGQKTLTGDAPPDADAGGAVRQGPSLPSPFPDYSAGTGYGKAGEIAVLIAGALLAFAAVYAISRIFSRSKSRDEGRKTG